MSKLTPTPVVDKNGKSTTVHKRSDDAGSSDARLGITPTIAVNQAPAVGSRAQSNITPAASFKMELGALFAEEDIMTEYVSRNNPGKPGLGIDIYGAEVAKTEHAVIQDLSRDIQSRPEEFQPEVVEAFEYIANTAPTVDSNNDGSTVMYWEGLSLDPQ